MKIRTILAPAVALVVGVVVGTASTGQADPVVRTKTVTERVEVEVTPQACLDALATTGDVMDLVVRFADTSVAWPNLVTRAAYAGMDMDVAEIKDITADVQSMTGEYNDITRGLKPLTRELTTSLADCRSH